MNKQNLILLIIVLFTLSCKATLSLNQWQGVGDGDSYLEIQDSLLVFNRPNQFMSTYKIQSISEDSIFCKSYDEETGQLKQSKNFHYSKGLGIISAQSVSSNQKFTSITGSNSLQRHQIKNARYRIYDYNEQLHKQYQLNQEGQIIESDKNLSIVKQTINQKKVKSIFQKLSILDFDNFEWTDKNFFMVSHAPCHCLEIHYNQDSKIKYCRQVHNNYISGILNEIHENNIH